MSNNRRSEAAAILASFREKMQAIDDKTDARVASINLRFEFFRNLHKAAAADGSKRPVATYAAFIDFLTICKAEGVDPLHILRPPS